MGAARHRAAHQVLERGAIFADPLAVRILGADAEAAIRAAPRHLAAYNNLGVLYFRKNGQWAKTVKPMPAEYGEWTHAYGAADEGGVGAAEGRRGPGGAGGGGGHRVAAAGTELAGTLSVPERSRAESGGDAGEGAVALPGGLSGGR